MSNTSSTFLEARQGKERFARRKDGGEKNGWAVVGLERWNPKYVFKGIAKEKYEL
jgi:hypothetical protein